MKYRYLTQLFFSVLIVLCTITPGNVFPQSDEVEQLIQEGITLKYAGEFEKSVQTFSRALERLKTQSDDPQKYAKIYYELARMYNGYAYNVPEKALDYLQKALQAVQKTNDRSLEAYIYFAFGLYYQNKDDDRRTQFYYEKSLAIHQEINNQRGIVIGTGDLGNVFLLRGDYERAIYQYQEAIRLCLEDESKFGNFIPGFYHNTAICYNIMQDLEQALFHEKKAMKYLAKVKDADHPNFLNYYNLLGHIYMDKGELDSAQVYLHKFHDIYKGSPRARLISNYHYQGILDMKKGEYKVSFAHLEQAQELAREVYGERNQLRASIYNDIAHTHAAMEDWEKALSATQEALMMNHQTFADSALSANPDFDGILSNNYFVADMINKVRFLNKNYRQQQDTALLEAGLSTSLHGIALIDSTRKTYSNKQTLSFFGTQAIQLYASAMEILFALHTQNPSGEYLEQAFDIAEKSRAYQLMRSLHEQEVRQQNINTPLVAREDSLFRRMQKVQASLEKLKEDSTATQSEINNVSKERAKLSLERTKTLRKIQQEFPEYYQTKHDLQTAKLYEIQGKLAKNEALVEYLLGEDQLFVLGITTTSATFLQKKLPSNNLKEIKELRKAMLEKDQATYQVKAHQLYALLWEGLDFSREIQRVKIIPDGILAYVPFSVLLRQKPKNGETAKDLQYLIRDYALSYDFSGGLAYGKEKSDGISKPGNQQLLAFAPSFAETSPAQPALASRELTRDNLSPLPGTKEEVKTIQKYFQSAVFTGDNATKTNFLQEIQEHSLIHLSTHAIVNDRSPGLSRLFFSSVKNEEDALFAYELQQMSIPAELITLSACNTGIGNIQAGEGVMSLARAFAYAGCKSSLISLWAVSDAGTANFIPRFYAYLAKGLEKDIALQQAKLEYLEEADAIGAQPFYWAGFVLNGSTRPVTSTKALNAWSWGGGILLLLTVFLGWFWVRRNRQGAV